MNAFADAFRADAWPSIGGTERIHSVEKETTPDTKFATEQIEGLVQQLFFKPGNRPARFVGFCAVDATVDLSAICRDTAKVLASRVTSDVCLLEDDAGETSYGGTDDEPDGISDDVTPRQSSRQIADRLRVCSRLGRALKQHCERDFIAGLRKQYEYSVVQLPPAVAGAGAISIGAQLDGIVLVLTANSTRKAVAQRVRDMFIAARIPLLGAVLCERTFPIPESIYRRV
jgi:hypothetical protein